MVVHHLSALLGQLWHCQGKDRLMQDTLALANLDVTSKHAPASPAADISLHV